MMPLLLELCIEWNSAGYVSQSAIVESGRGSNRSRTFTRAKELNRFQSRRPNGSDQTAKGASNSATSMGGNVTFRVIGGSLLPVAINLQAGGSRTTASGSPDITGIIAGGGISASVPTPGVSIEPYLFVTNRWAKVSGISGTNSDIGWTLGANVGLGMFGFHVAYDSQKSGGVTGSVIGIGAHIALKAPVGM